MSRLSVQYPALVLACFATSCGGLTHSATEDTAEAFRSGDRLRARTWIAEKPVSPDGTKAAQRIAWYDTELEVDCEFSMGVDGTYRCYPAEEVIKLANPSPTCDPDEHLAQLPVGSSGCSQRYASKREWIGDCLGEQRVLGLRLGELVSTGENTAYGYTPLYSTDECVEVTLALDAVYAFCDVEVVPQDTFVTAREELRPVGQVLQQVLLGDDGSMQILALRHPELGVNLYTAEGELIPEVTNVAGDFAFADAACTVPVVPDDRHCAPAVRVEPECGAGQTHRIGPRIDEFFALDATGACIRHPNSALFLEAEVNGGPSYHALEEALPRIDSEERVAGDGRLGILWVEHDGEAIFPTGYFFDRDLETACYPEETEDGSTQCVPSHRYDWIPLFEDASCANASAYRSPDSCTRPPPAAYAQVDGVLSRMFPFEANQPLFQWAYQAPIPPETVESPCIPWTGETALWRPAPVDPADLAPLTQILE